MRMGLAKCSLVEYSTRMRAVRSLRAQTMALSRVTSPLMMPLGNCGRRRSEVTMAGATAKTAGLAITAALPTAVAALSRRKRRRLWSAGEFWSGMATPVRVRKQRGSCNVAIQYDRSMKAG
jgi:post-segregation antitoxin (ccd killing protein)